MENNHRGYESLARALDRSRVNLLTIHTLNSTFCMYTFLNLFTHLRMQIKCISPNLIDELWQDRPNRPANQIVLHPVMVHLLYSSFPYNLCA